MVFVNLHQQVFFRSSLLSWILFFRRPASAGVFWIQICSRKFLFLVVFKLYLIFCRYIFVEVIFAKRFEMCISTFALAQFFFSFYQNLYNLYFWVKINAVIEGNFSDKIFLLSIYIADIYRKNSVFLILVTIYSIILNNLFFTVTFLK